MLLPTFPLSTLAISGGPNPPEYSSFEKVAVGDLVDPFTGNVQYSLPLFEVGGYPINLTYSGDIHMEQNAGWVGLGWSLQAGSIGRAMRGLPDDFKGDAIQKKITQRPRKVTTYEFNHFNDEGQQVELFGLKGGITMPGFPSLVTDNYRGFGINYDLNVSFAIRNRLDTVITRLMVETVGEKKDSLKVWIDSLDIFKPDLSLFDFNTSYSAFDGNSYSVVPRFGFIDKMDNSFPDDVKKLKLLLSNPGIRFHSHHGLQSIGMQSGWASQKAGRRYNFGYNFASPSFLPWFNPDMHTTVRTGVITMSSDKVFADGGTMSVKVTQSVEKYSDNDMSKQAVGYLYQDEADKMDDVISDYQTSPMLLDKHTKMLAPTVGTYDVFNISATGVGGSFRVKHGSVGIVSPPNHKVTSVSNPSLSAELGGGTNAKIGGEFGLRYVMKKTEKWTDKNDVAQYYTFKEEETNNLFEPAVMRNNFEFIESPQDINQGVYQTEAVKAGLHRNNKGKLSAWRASSKLYNVDDQHVYTVGAPVALTERSPRQQSVTWLTAAEASEHGITKKLQNYLFDETSSCFWTYNTSVSAQGGVEAFVKLGIDRTKSYRQGHHISEINVLQPDGTTYNFGLPVYQTSTTSVDFSKEATSGTKDLNRGLTSYEEDVDDGLGNTNGIENSFQEVTTPAYATTWLLTNILSQDYSDLTGDGPTKDDIGTYVKFNYGLVDYDASQDNPQDEENYDPAHHLFNWRSPYDLDQANWSRGYESDNLDDKASYSYGRREQWYMHSIETKDRIVVFELKDRADGFGANGRHGGIDTDGNKEKYLSQIKIYTRSAFEKDGLSANPLKTINLHYSYDQCVGISSFVNPYIGGCGATPDHPLADFDQTTYGSKTMYDGGKLTLHKVEFIEGELGMATKEPYVFEYKTENPQYFFGAVDRWGTYHPYNLYATSGLNLSQHPYTWQNKADVDDWASAWMLSDITLPSGAHISLDYEADDYAYVQDKKAKTMIQIKGIRQSLTHSDYNDLYLDDPKGMLGTDVDLEDIAEMASPNLFITFERFGYDAVDYIPDDSMIYFSFNVDLARHNESNAYEQVSGFFEIEKYGNVPNSSLGYIKVKKYEMGKRNANVHPVTKMAWQYAFSNLPHLMNPKGYTARSSGWEKVEDGVKQVIGILPEYVKMIVGESAYFLALGHGQKVNLTRSYLRLNKPGNHKFGGGHRVKKVTLSDDWQAMTANDETEGTYSTSYSYETTDDNGDVISSGVAVYEPFVGGDENPHKMPLNFEALRKARIKQLKPLAPVTISYDMAPVGEEFYPSPGVGYSKVTIKSDAPHSQIVRHLAGRTEYEFYTARDYPTRSYMTQIGQRIRKFNSPKLVSSDKAEQTNEDGSAREKPTEGEKKRKFKFGLDVTVNLGFGAASQGFVIEQNDMHGKPRSVKVYKQGSAEALSSTIYHYKTDGDGKLVNDVTVLREDGTFEQVEMGVQIDPTVFAYRTTEVNQDGAIAPNLDVQTPMPTPIVISILGSYGMYSNDSRVMTFTKQVYRNGILDSVEVNDKGAYSHTKNLAWDGVTGKVLLTEGKDEFDQPIYTLSKPAYWMNSALAGAYNNIGLEVELVQSGSDWTDPTGALLAGDVLVKSSFTDDIKYWVLDRSGSVVTLIDKDGNPVSPPSESLKVFRSAHRNLLNFGAETIVMQENPLNETTGHWDDNLNKVISSEAIDYNDERKMRYKFRYCYTTDCNLSTSFIEGGLRETTYGYGYRNAPSHYGTVGFNYEQLIDGPGGGLFYGKPTFCNECDTASLPPPCDYCPTAQYFEIGDLVNPYVYGLKGIWRPFSDVAYYEKRDAYAQRSQDESTPGNPNTTDVSKAGYLEGFTPYWTYAGGNWQSASTQSIGNPWTWTQAVSVTDYWGNDLQAENALDVPNTVLYDYEQRVPVAVVANAEHHEILFDGFEDYSTTSYVELNCLDASTPQTTNLQSSWQEEFCNQNRHWRVADALVGGTNRISSQQAHTGHHSLMLGLGQTVIQLENNNRTASPTSRSTPMASYDLRPSDFVESFYIEPTATKEYIISFWVKEGISSDVDEQLILSLTSSVATPVTLTRETADVHVNGWTKRTYRFSMAAGEELLDLTFENKLENGGDPLPCYVDDIMIYPAKSVMNAYVYDRDKKRVMATLSPNNFATFYEYNLEGNMIRQKVETDRGIMTVSESRQSMIDR